MAIFVNWCTHEDNYYTCTNMHCPVGARGRVEFQSNHWCTMLHGMHILTREAQEVMVGTGNVSTVPDIDEAVRSVII